MEVEVRIVAGVAKLPCITPNKTPSNTGIRSSKSPTPSLPPSSTPLSLSPPPPHRLWHVSWSGASSSSSFAAAIEIAQEFAACIGLPNGTTVQVRVLPNVAKASLVTIEPATEDDWEVVELNAESTESAILNQVWIIQGKMTFPLWLHGHRIVTFTVVSMLPDNIVVQLGPGTEVAVAPKRRRKPAEQYQGSSLESVNGSHSEKALLRLQDPKNVLIHESHLGGRECGH